MIPSSDEIKVYGCSIEDFRKSVESSISVKLGMGGYPMVLMSILSDAQTLVELGRYDDARKEINKAKWLVNEYLTPKSGRKEPHAVKTSASTEVDESNKVLARVLRRAGESPTDFRARCARALDIVRKESNCLHWQHIARFARRPGGTEFVVGACHAWIDDSLILPSDECLIAKVAEVDMFSSSIPFDARDLDEMRPFEVYHLWATDHSNGRDFHVREGSYESLKKEAAAMNARGRDYWIKDDPACAAEGESQEGSSGASDRPRG